MKLEYLDKIGAFGALFAAGACPACFPLMAIAGSALGLGFLRPYEGVTMIVFQTLVFMAFIGNAVSFIKHRKIWILAVGAISPALIFFAFYVKFSATVLYTGLFGLTAAAMLNFFANKKCKTCEERSQ